MPKWLNNIFYVIIVVVSMGCTMQGIEWKSYKKKEKDKQPGKYSL